MLLGGAIKLMENIRYAPDLGRIVQMIGFILKDDTMYFLIFYVVWVAVFGFSF